MNPKSKIQNPKLKRAPQGAFDIVGIGLCASDYISLVARYPGSNEKTLAEQSSHQGGSPVPTALCVAAKWGARTAFLGMVGDDPDGRFVLDELQRFGVDTSRVAVRPGVRTTNAFIWVERGTGNRAIVCDRTRMPPVRPRDVLPLPACRLLHTDGRDAPACLAAMRAARRAGGAVMMDAGSVRPRMDDLIAATDYLICSQQFIRELFGRKKTPESVVRALLRRGPRLAMVTLGAAGCIGATADGLFRVAAHHRENFVLDTTGAGDVFHGAFLYGLLRGWDVRRCAEVANATAFLKCAHLGGRIGIPTLAAAIRLANSR